MYGGAHGLPGAVYAAPVEDRAELLDGGGGHRGPDRARSPVRGGVGSAPAKTSHKVIKFLD